LLGSALLYANCGLTSLDGIYVFSNIEIPSTSFTTTGHSEILSMGLLIMSCGYLFKISAAPFHFWSPAGWSGKSSIRDKLPNSGDPLKLLVPSYIRKIISGWINYSCMVISQEIDERKMGYRGSKSGPKKSVKEQRVDGSWYDVLLSFLLILFLYFRYTLIGFERNSQIKIPSNQIQQKRLYSTKKTYHGNNISVNNPIKVINLPETNKLTLLNIPWFVTGFTDAEGSFMIVIRKREKWLLRFQG
jgi:hypothetical protein